MIIGVYCPEKERKNWATIRMDKWYNLKISWHWFKMVCTLKDLLLAENNSKIMLRMKITQQNSYNLPFIESININDVKFTGFNRQ